MHDEQKSELPKSVFGVLDKYGEKLWKGVRFLYKEASKETRLSWRLGYERYLEKAASRYYFAKSFLRTEDPQPLYEFYVPLSVGSRLVRLDKTSIVELTAGNPFVVIVASGGSGKTMLMRHLFMDTLEST